MSTPGSTNLYGGELDFRWSALKSNSRLSCKLRLLCNFGRPQPYTPRMFEYDVALAATVNTDTHQIARGLRQRDVALLHALVGQYQYRLIRYFTYLLGRRDPVDDLVQETWLRILERGHSYDGQSRFEPWLFTVARNLAFDYMRKRPTFSLDSKDSPEPDLESLSPVSHAPSPFEQAARTEDAQRSLIRYRCWSPSIEKRSSFVFRKICHCRKWRT